MTSSVLIRGAQTNEGIVDVKIYDNHIIDIQPRIAAQDKDEVVDARGLILWPGLVNTHHHLAQSLLKGVPAAIDSDLDEWLPRVPFAAWPNMTPETLFTAACVGFSELLRSGCTTCADHHYLYDEQTSDEMEDALFEAAEKTGIRFILCRGSATSSGTHRGLNADRIETIELWEKRMTRSLLRHDPAEDSMSRVVVAPTSLVHSTGPEHLRLMAEFARFHKLRMHSHLLEILRDETTAKERFGCSADEYAESVNWLGEDVWYAHLVYASNSAIARFARSGTGISHCPVSNCRLGSGIANLPEMSKKGMPISIGVDGSASAESGSMVNEMMQAWLLHRAVGGPDVTRVEEVIDWGTRGGADILGLNAGRLTPGSVADLVLFDVDAPRFLGVWNANQAPVICGEPIKAKKVMVNGRWVAQDGVVNGLDYDTLRTSVEIEKRRLQRAMA